PTPPTPPLYTLSLHDALPICQGEQMTAMTFSGTTRVLLGLAAAACLAGPAAAAPRVDGDVGGSVVDSTSGTPLSGGEVRLTRAGDRKSTRLNSSHGSISYAVF